MPHALFAPAVALLDRLDFRHKFLLVGVLILLPLAYLLVDLALDMADTRDTTRRELQGVALLRDLTSVILDTQRHRGYINAHLGGAPGALERARQAAGGVDAGLRRLAGHLGHDWLDERARRRQAALADEWRRLAANAAGMPGADSFQAHNALVGGWLEYAIETADAAGLTLDARRATYYLQDTLMRALLPLMEETARLRGQAAGLLARKGATADERVELAARLEAARMAARQARLNLDKVFAADAGTGAVLEPRLAEAEKRLGRLAETTRAEVLGGAFAVSGLDYFAQASDVLDRQRHLHEAGLERLDEALTRRLDGIATRQALTLAGVGALVGIALYFAIAITLSITRAVRGIEAMTGALGRGELGSRLAPPGRDEMGRVAAGLNGAAEGLSALVREVRQAIGAWKDAADALSSGAGEIAQAVIGQNNDSAASAAAVQELAVSIAHVAEQTRHTHELARESGALAARGGQEAAAASEEMAATAAAVRDTASEIEALDARVRDIEAIARAIKEIAKQTDLLALNAAIEAARAGEAGRGFAVVADEVRKLAERTTAATGEIDALLGLIDQQTRAAIDAMHDNAARVTGGTEQSARTAALLARIQRAFGEVVGRVDEIAHASREQEAAGVELARNMERIAQANERNSVQAEQVSVFAGHMRGNTESIRARLNRFSI